jgi:hypothetical protein
MILYTPHKGFFDLSQKPKSLSKREYEKIKKIQMFLINENENKDYYKKHNKVQWEKLKVMAADLQQIILQYWKLEELG